MLRIKLISSAVRRNIILFIMAVFLPAVYTSGQCPDRSELWERLNYLAKNSSTITSQDQLKELLAYEANIRNCDYRKDSIRSLLLQRIGAAYLKQDDYLLAIKFISQSIRLVNAGGESLPVNTTCQIRNYFILSKCYEFLNRGMERMKAVDSVVSISLRSAIINNYCFYALTAKVKYLLDVGDYNKCIYYADLGEKITRQYAHGKDSLYYMMSFLTWKMNSLFILKQYDLAEELLANKVDEYKKRGGQHQLGTVYELMARLQIYQKNYGKAKSSFQQALTYYQKVGFNVGCKQVLTNLGYHYYFLHNKDSKNALACYKKALGYSSNKNDSNKSDSIESLNIFANIANVYVEAKLYDSASYYFQLAFNQIRAGTTETDLLRISLEEFVQLKKLGYLVNLLLDKGDAFLKQYKTAKNIQALREAVNIYKVTDRLLDRIKAGQTEIQSKLFWRENTRRLYELAIEASYAFGNTDNAFYFFEKAGRFYLMTNLMN